MSLPEYVEFKSGSKFALLAEDNKKWTVVVSLPFENRKLSTSFGSLTEAKSHFDQSVLVKKKNGQEQEFEHLYGSAAQDKITQWGVGMTEGHFPLGSPEEELVSTSTMYEKSLYLTAQVEKRPNLKKILKKVHLFEGVENVIFESVRNKNNGRFYNNELLDQLDGMVFPEIKCFSICPYRGEVDELNQKNIEVLSRVFPNIEMLYVFGRVSNWGTLELPKLKTLELCGPFHKRKYALDHLKLPSLESFELMLEDGYEKSQRIPRDNISKILNAVLDNSPTSLKVEGIYLDKAFIENLLDHANTKKLKELKISADESDDDLSDELARAKQELSCIENLSLPLA